MRRKLSIAIILILGLSFLATIQPTSANFSVTVNINDAYYADLDQDGYEDDIKVDLTLYLDNRYIYTDIDLYIGITLPSGTEYWFLFQFTVEKYTYCAYTGMRIDLLNTATESGWYWADAVGFAEGERFSYMDSLLFDPPGGTPGGDPQGMADFYDPEM